MRAAGGLDALRFAAQTLTGKYNCSGGICISDIQDVWGVGVLGTITMRLWQCCKTV